MRSPTGIGVLLLVALAGCHGSRAKPSQDAATDTSTQVAGPDVSTHASTLAPEDADTPVEVSGEVDATALRARNRARLAADHSPVFVLQGSGAHAAFDLGQRLCEAVVPHKPAETPFLLKPNLGGFDWFKDPAKTGGDDGVRGRTTDPEFVRGVVRCLRARGHEHVTIAEGWGATHKDWEQLVQVTGYARMAREENVALVALDDDGVFDVQGDQPGKPLGVRGMEATGMPTLLVPKLLADTLAHGVFISLPKMKAHRYAVFSLSVKGMQGTIMTSDKAPAFHNKWRTHRELVPWMKKQGQGKEDRAEYVASLEKFADRIADVLEVEAPDVVLAEGAPMMGGDGFEKLWPSVEKVAVGGTNPILVDRVGAQLLGLWDRDELARELGGHRTSPLLETAAKRFGVDIASPAVTGDGAALLSTPRPAHLVAMASFAIHSDARPALTPAGIAALATPSMPSTPNPSSTTTSPPVAHAANLGDDRIALDGNAADDAWRRAVPGDVGYRHGGQLHGHPDARALRAFAHGPLRPLGAAGHRLEHRPDAAHGHTPPQALRGGLRGALLHAGSEAPAALLRDGARAVRALLRRRGGPGAAHLEHSLVERRARRDDAGRGRAHGDDRGGAHQSGVSRALRRARREAADRVLPDGRDEPPALPRLEPAPHAAPGLPRAVGVRRARHRSVSCARSPRSLRACTRSPSARKSEHARIRAAWRMSWWTTREMGWTTHFDGPTRRTSSGSGSPA